MDKIKIKDLEVYAFHGVNQAEKELGQMFFASVEIGADLKDAAETDELKKTIHYGHVCRDIEAVLKSQKRDLIEAAANDIIIKIFENYPAAKTVRVKLKKPWAPMGRHLKYVAVELERSRSSYER